METISKLKRSNVTSYKSRYIEEKAQLQQGIRERISREVVDWAESPDQERRMLVIYGPAGVGKSAIARAVSETFAGKYLGDTHPRYPSQCPG